MKEWKKPQLKSLGLENTKEGMVCIGVGTMFPDDNITSCSAWDVDKRCTSLGWNPNDRGNWPCDQAIANGSN